MFASSFDEANAVLDRPEDMTREQCPALCVCRAYSAEAKIPVIVSCWKPTKAEIKEIIKTGRIWLTVAGETMPPVVLTGFKPTMTVDEG